METIYIIVIIIVFIIIIFFLFFGLSINHILEKEKNMITKIIELKPSFCNNTKNTASDIIKYASGMTYQPNRNSLLITTNNPPAIYEYKLPNMEFCNKYNLFGFEDTEGICFISGNNILSQVAIIEEEKGITILELDGIKKNIYLVDGKQFINLDLNNLFDSGLEGITFNKKDNEFYVAIEDKNIYRVGFNGKSSILFKDIKFKPYIDNISGLYWDNSRNLLYILSNKSNKIISIDLNGKIYQEIWLGGTDLKGITGNDKILFVAKKFDGICSYDIKPKYE